MLITPRYIVNIILSLAFMIALFTMLPNIVPSAITAVGNYFTNLSTLGTTLGTGAAAFAGQVNGITGWFWVIGGFVLVVMVILAVFMPHKGRY